MTSITNKLSIGTSTFVPKNQKYLKSDDGDSCKEVSRRVSELSPAKDAYGSRANPRPQGRPPKDSGVRNQAEPPERKRYSKNSSTAKNSYTKLKPVLKSEQEQKGGDSALPKERPLTPEEEAATMKWALDVCSGEYFF